MRKVLTFLVLTTLLTAGLLAQGTLSQQVLQLLARTNSWTGTNTFYDIRIPILAVPSITTARIYTDVAGNLYYNGGLIAGAGGGVTPHNLLSSTHADTLAGTVVRGDFIVGNTTPAWNRLARCASGEYIGSDGTDTLCRTSAAGFTAIPAGQITGTASAFDGAAITALNAGNLGSGTVPLARLSGITNTEIAAGAGIVYSKLSLTTSIVNADVSASAAIAYTKLNLANSVVTGDIANATLLFADWASNGCTNLQVPQFNGSAWVCKSLVVSDITNGGTVTSAALTLPAIFSVAGSPITTSGTFTVTLATETANTVWAGPASAGPSAPTFRALVNADLPLSGVGAGSYTKVTVNTAGIVTAATTADLSTADVTGTLTFGKGGTGVSVAADDTALVSNGSAWQVKTIPDCTTGALNYTQATNLFSCNTTSAPHNLLSASHGDTTGASAIRGDLIVADSTPKWVRRAIGGSGSFLVSDGTDPNWGTRISGLEASVIGSGTLGTVARPFASIILGTAATNNLTVTPAAFTNGLVATIDNPGTFTTAKLPLVRRGTIAFTSTAITNGTCATAVTATETGLATTSAIAANLNGALQTNWQTGVTYFVYPTSNTVNIRVCNPTAGSITPESATFNYVAFVP